MNKEDYKKLYEKLKEMFEDDFNDCPVYYFGDGYIEKHEDGCTYECKLCHRESYKKWEREILKND